MVDRDPAPNRPVEATVTFTGPFRVFALMAVVVVALMAVRVVADATAPAAPGATDGGLGTGGSPAPGAVASGKAASPNASPARPTVDPASYLLASPQPAPDLRLTGPDGATVDLATLRGTPVLVFFGYTHCPDVCPATIGTVGQAIDAVDGEARAIFVSVDPERDTTDWLAEFVRYMPPGFSAATGTPSEVATTAAAWGVRYAKVDTGDAVDYAMSHTADVLLVDRAGRLRASFPFGTEADAMTAVLRSLDNVGPSPGAPSAAPSNAARPSPALPSPAVPASPPAQVKVVRPEVVSSSVWAGGASPVILALHDETGRLDDETLRLSVTVLDPSGTPLGPAVPATNVGPPGMTERSFVATLDIPLPGTWRIRVEAVDAAGTVHRGTADVVALDPGGTARLGEPAPTIRTPTAADVGGDLTWLSTDPLPDPRLSQTSTADALAAGEPFVFVVDSSAFKVTPACGRALVLAKRLLDRWGEVPFIHHEPYRYQVVTSEPVLEGTLQAPVLTAVAEAWGVGAPPWGVGSMPWVFVVDGDGVVRAKYQGILGSADVDVMLSLLQDVR